MYSNPKKLYSKKHLSKSQKYVPCLSLSKSLAERLTNLPGLSKEYEVANCRICRFVNNCIKEKFILEQKALNDEEDYNSSGAVGICRYILRHLYKKYASSQNYYYLKGINSIIAKKRIRCYILFRDYEDFYDTETEQLKRVYSQKDYKRKLVQLSEYYKYHVEIPRIFCKDCTDNYFDYHDKKRQIEYYKVKNLLKKLDGEEGDSQIALKRAKEKSSRGFIPILKLNFLNEKQNLLEKKSNKFDSNLYNNKPGIGIPLDAKKNPKSNDKKKNDETNQTLQSIYKKQKKAVDDNVISTKKRETSAITFSNDITNNTHLSLANCFEESFFNNNNGNDEDKVCFKPQAVFKKKLNKPCAIYANVVMGSGGGNVCNVFQESNFQKHEGSNAITEFSGFNRPQPPQNHEIITKHKKNTLSEINTKNLIQIKEQFYNEKQLDKEQQRLKENLMQSQNLKNNKTTKRNQVGISKEDFLDLRKNSGHRNNQNLHIKDYNEDHIKNSKSARNPEKYEIEMAHYNDSKLNQISKPQIDLIANANMKDCMNMKIFFDKKNINNQVESQKGTPDNNLGTSNNGLENFCQQKVLAKNLSNSKNSHSSKVVKIYTARPDWPGRSPNTNTGNANTYNQIQKQYLDLGLPVLGNNNNSPVQANLSPCRKQQPEEQNPNSNKSTKTFQPQIYNSNNSSNHVKQKSSSNLNEFVIRKSSANELQSERLAVRFESKKVSIENMNGTAKCNNIKKTIVKSSRSGGQTQNGYHSHKPSNNLETLQIGNFFGNFNNKKSVHLLGSFPMKVQPVIEILPSMILKN